ncbi:MAG: Sjogren's syndrome/scleroderma autoantigen 1 family protein [Thermoproteota archaeon]|nr:hypothetical protein [Candidatus Brockarchaeota archaeon]
MSLKFDVKKMAEALQSGAVMMAAHCGSCGAPLFRYRDGRVKCVNCGRLYKHTRTGEVLEELSSLEYGMEEAFSLLKEVEERLLEIKDEHKLRSIVDALKRILNELAETG